MWSCSLQVYQSLIQVLVSSTGKQLLVLKAELQVFLDYNSTEMKKFHCHKFERIASMVKAVIGKSQFLLARHKTIVNPNIFLESLFLNKIYKSELARKPFGTQV